MKHSMVSVGSVGLHVVEHGEGPAVIFCHGFPDLWIGWRLQMEALAAAGYRAISLDMRGYGKSSAPRDVLAYTPLHTVGDLVGVLDALGLATVTIVGHDFGASVAWSAALMRPDRFNAVFGVSVPFLPRGDLSLLDAMRAAGKQRFYMFDQMRPEADAAWANAAVTYPSVLYWTSGSASPEEAWDPFDAERTMYRPAPAPPWADPEDLAYATEEFQRTGFGGGLNYYRSIQSGFELTAPFKGALVHQPSFFLIGGADALNKVVEVSESRLKAVLPGLRGFLELPGVGHWPQREASRLFNDALIGFLNAVT